MHSRFNFVLIVQLVLSKQLTIDLHVRADWSVAVLRAHWW